MISLRIGDFKFKDRRRKIKNLLLTSFQFQYFCSTILTIVFILSPVINCDEIASLHQLNFKQQNKIQSFSQRRTTKDTINVSHSLLNKINTYGSPPFTTKHIPQQFYGDNSSTTLTKTFPFKKDLVSFNLIEGLRVDLCESYCDCDRISNFITVNCDYRKSPKLDNVFDSKYKVPSGATSIRISLGPGTKFVLKNGFFNQNKVNSFQINGTNSGRDQVEISKGGFDGIGGGYPEVILTDIFSVIVRELVFNDTIRFIVRNSNDLNIITNAFSKATIKAKFQNIKDLQIDEKAFSAGTILIEDSYLGDISRFEASLNEIRFYKCSINTINAGAFDVNTINSIIFESCRIDTIKARAVTDKLLSKHISIRNGVIGYIESEAIFGSGIAELILSKNTIEKIDKRAIQATAVNVTITGNSIKDLDINWLHIKQWSNVVLENNRFGRFGAIKLEEQGRPSRCTFYNNSITEPLPGCLNFSDCQIHKISFNIKCNCNTTWLSFLTDHDMRSETYCTIDDRLSNCFGTKNLNYLNYINNVCDEKKTTLQCPGNQTLEKVNGNFYTREELAQGNYKKSILNIVGIGGIVSICVIILILIAILIGLYCFKKRTKENSAYPQTMSHVHEFSMSDRNIMLQTLELMEKKYKEIYRPVNYRIEILLKPNLSNKKCIEVVSQIVNLLGKVDSPPDEFIAFNQMLASHLQPSLPNAPPPDPIYTEPGNLFPQNTEESLAVIGLSEHIYAEPSCAQQPLLPNEYASPADRSTEPIEVYTEPISERVPTVSFSARQQKNFHNPIEFRSQDGGIGLPVLLGPVKPPRQLPDVLASQQSITSATNRDIQLSTFLNPHSTQIFSSNPLNNAALYTTPHSQPTKNSNPQPNKNWEQLGAFSLAPDSGSNHSGGTNETVPIDDIIEYVDA